jgi:hypothetical protein
LKEAGVLTIEHCIALSGLSPEAVAALAEYDHLPDIVADELGNYLGKRSVMTLPKIATGGSAIPYQCESNRLSLAAIAR